MTMKDISLILVIGILTIPQSVSAQRTIAPRFNIDRDGYQGKSKADTLYFKDKKIKGIGHVAQERDSTKSDLKIGLWTEYYSNGQVRAKGNYQIDSYINCCITDTCKMYSNYKLGQWEYFYPNGQIKAIGTYTVRKTQIKTSCSGGDKILRSYVDLSWRYYDDKGQKIKINKELRGEIENASR
jgi:hypothetical protein